MAESQVPVFGEPLHRQEGWRRAGVARLQELAAWLALHDWLDSALSARLQRLQQLLQVHRTTVAFVAEFSSGKSELINAIFFAHLGRRIMPASAGRTTMCPTELGHDPRLPPCLRLLPIETRVEPQSLSDWQAEPGRWTQIALDPQDPAQMAAAMAHVAQTQEVAPEQAMQLGFVDDQDGSTPGLAPNARGLVEVPRWRHAMVNLDHPLLRQGLVVLDTPGLNAIGAEPELTMGLIPQADAVVYLMAADTGVTRSDLAVWRHCVAAAGEADEDTGGFRLAVLNKIDTLWDGITPPEEIEAQLRRQCTEAAQLLGLPAAQVMPVSAQKGLAARIQGNAELLQASRLPALEQALAEGVAARQRRRLQRQLRHAWAEVQAEVARLLAGRRRDLAAQRDELQGLRGKNRDMVGQLRQRVLAEQRQFEAGLPRLQALRSVHARQLRELVEQLGARALKPALAPLQQVLGQTGLKFGMKAAYTQTFERLDEGLARAVRASSELVAMVAAAQSELNTTLGLGLQVPAAPDLVAHARDLAAVRRNHDRYLGLVQGLRLAQPAYAERLLRVLVGHVRAVHEAAQAELMRWHRLCEAQFDAELRERQASFTRRLQALERVEQAAGQIDERLQDLTAQVLRLDAQAERVAALGHALQLDAPAALLAA